MEHLSRTAALAGLLAFVLTLFAGLLVPATAGAQDEGGLAITGTVRDGDREPVEGVEFTATQDGADVGICLLYTSPSPRDQRGSRMPSSA